MNGKLNKNIGFSLLPLALFFLFEPFFTVWDVLPDFIGYVIICFALINLSDINDRVKDAFSGFRKAVIINFLRLPVMYLLRNYFIGSEQTVSLLIFTFGFAVLELLVLLPAYKSLFNSILNLGFAHGGSFVCQSKKAKGRTFTEKTYTLTFWFLLIKYSSATLPEFTTLISNDSFEFIVLLRIVGFLVSIVCGFIWLIKTYRYFANVRKDTSFIQRLSEIYVAYSRENQGYYISRSIKVALYLIIAASVFSIGFYSDYIDLLPDVAFYVLIIFAALILKKHSRKWTLLLSISALGVITSLSVAIKSSGFYSEFYPMDVLKSVKAYDSFYTMLGLRIADTVVFILTFCVFIIIAWDIYKKHTDIAFENNTAKTQRNRFVKATLLPAVFALLSAGANVFYLVSQPFAYIDKWYFEYAAMISVAFSILLFSFMCYYINFLINSVKTHYHVFD